MKHLEPPFHSGEIVTAKVVGFGPRYAALQIRRCVVPLDVLCIDWDAHRDPQEVLSIGSRIEVVVYVSGRRDQLHMLHCVWPRYLWNNLWASRLPLLDNPWPEFEERYPEGSVVEVEMIDYVNWYIARVRMPHGHVTELRTNDIHMQSKQSSVHHRKLRPGERFRIVVRSLYRSGGWVERHVGGSVQDTLDCSGFVSPIHGEQSLTEVEQAFIANRDRRLA